MESLRRSEMEAGFANHLTLPVKPTFNFHTGGMGMTMQNQTMTVLLSSERAVLVQVQAVGQILLLMRLITLLGTNNHTLCPTVLIILYFTFVSEIIQVSQM